MRTCTVLMKIKNHTDTSQNNLAVWKLAVCIYQIRFSEPIEYILVPILYCMTFYASKSEDVVLTYSMLNFWVLLTKFDEVLD